MFNLCFTLEASASILRDNCKRVRQISLKKQQCPDGLTSPPQMTARHDPSTFSAGLIASTIFTYTIFFKSLTADISKSRVDFSSDDSSRTRRVVTARQHFQAASPPPLSSHSRFFLSLSPPGIYKSRVDFSSDDLSQTRRVVTTRQHFQAASPPPLSSHTRFFLSLSHLTFPRVGSTFQVTTRHELDIFRKFLKPAFKEQLPFTLLPQTPRPVFRLTGRLHQKVDPTPFVCIGQPSRQNTVYQSEKDPGYPNTQNPSGQA